jgi:hypothetical protein
MIDSSEHIREPPKMVGFDLEKGRDLVWAASERKTIWTTPGGTGYRLDIGKHRELQAVVEICDKQFPSAIDEIERLREIIDSPTEEESWKAGYGLFLCAARKWHDAYRKAHNSNLLRKQEIERLRALRSDIITAINRPKTTSDNGLLLYIRDEVDYNIRQAAKIQALEGMLMEERAKNLNPTNTQWDRLPEEDRPDRLFPATIIKGKTSLRELARQQLIEEGKIGPDADTKPHCWQVTDERIRGLKSILCELALCDADEYVQERDGTVLLAMLDEVSAEGKTWQ